MRPFPKAIRFDALGIRFEAVYSQHCSNEPFYGIDTDLPVHTSAGEVQPYVKAIIAPIPYKGAKLVVSVVSDSPLCSQMQDAVLIRSNTAQLAFIYNSHFNRPDSFSRSPYLPSVVCLIAYILAASVLCAFSYGRLLSFAAPSLTRVYLGHVSTGLLFGESLLHTFPHNLRVVGPRPIITALYPVWQLQLLHP